MTNVRDQGSSSVTLYVCGSRASLAHRTHTSPGRTVERACGPTLRLELVHLLVVLTHSTHFCTRASQVVVQARMAHRAKGKFTELTKPRRPPLPGTATPAGYHINRRGETDSR